MSRLGSAQTPAVVVDDGLLVLDVDHLAAPNTKSSPSMVLMNPAADKLLLDLVERSLSGQLHASRSPPAPPTWPWQSNLRAVVSLFWFFEADFSLSASHVMPKCHLDCAQSKSATGVTNRRVLPRAASSIRSIFDDPEL